MRQHALIALLIFVVCVSIYMTLRLAVRPILSGVSHIQEELPIPEKGANEFRFLAKTYNQFYEANKKHNEKLAYEATHDSLTGLYNRSGCDIVLSKIDVSKCALLIVDIDLFKSINDSFGHEVGDKELVRVSGLLQDNFHSEDAVCRIGGDEFFIVMQNADASKRDRITQKIALINEKLSIEEDGIPPSSISCGCAFGSNADSFDELSKHADTALYRVKENGRAGCAFYEG